MSVTRALIVGAGVMGRRHADAIRAAGDVIAVVVDADAARAQALSPDAVVASTLEEALGLRGLYDVAVLATPSALHLEQSALLLAADLPVLIEKPHRVPGQSTELLHATLAQTAGYAFIGMTTRHWPGMETVAQAVADGSLGEVLTYRDRMGYRLESDSLPEWYFQPGTSGGGIVVTNGVHAIDRARAMLGDFSVDSSSSAMPTPEQGLERYALIEGRTGAGARVSIELLWTPYEPLNTGLVITGTLGNASVCMDGSWSISTVSGEHHGEAIDVETVPFVRQWRAFLDRRPGFSVDELEPTLALIERFYEEDSDG